MKHVKRIAAAALALAALFALPALPSFAAIPAAKAPPLQCRQRRHCRGYEGRDCHRPALRPVRAWAPDPDRRRLHRVGLPRRRKRPSPASTTTPGGWTRCWSAPAPGRMSVTTAALPPGLRQRNAVCPSSVTAYLSAPPAKPAEGRFLFWAKRKGPAAAALHRRQALFLFSLSKGRSGGADSAPLDQAFFFHFRITPTPSG